MRFKIQIVGSKTKVNFFQEERSKALRSRTLKRKPARVDPEKVITKQVSPTTPDCEM